MNIRIYTFFGILSYIHAQSLTSYDPDPIVIFEGTSSSSATFNLSSSFIGTNYLLQCQFLSPVIFGYSFATFSSGPQQIGTGTSLNFTVTINAPLTVGRVRDFLCNFASQPLISITKYLSIKPPIKAYVCGNNTVVKNVDTNLAVSQVVSFSDPLTASATVSCSSSQTTNPVFTSTATQGSLSVQVNAFYNAAGSADSWQCTFGLGTTSSNFVVNITFLNRVIFFSPNTIETSSPVIQLNFMSNYNPLNDLIFNCYIVPRTNPNCVPPANAGINWTLTPTQITFTAASRKLFQLTMTKGGPFSNVIEQYSVACCDSANVQYRANVTILNNSTQYALIGTGAETQYSDLPYSPLSTCPCDLTVAVCDLNCCCDPFCNCIGNAAVIPGPYGGYFNDPLPYSCRSQDLLSSSPFHSLMCVQNESPNVIGNYFPMQPIINDVNTFARVLSSSIRPNTFQIMPTDSTNNPQPATGLIPLITNNKSPLVLPRFLYLPKQSVPGSSTCDLRNPIVLLQGYNSTCTYAVTSANCQTIDDPRLTSYFYLLSSTATQSNCNSNVGIISISGDIPVFTFYKCVTAPNTVVNCTFDNGYNFPPPPQFSPGVCQNVVSSVSYTIYYNPSDLSISYVSAIIELTSANIGTNLEQRFNVSFTGTSSSVFNARSQSFLTLRPTSTTAVSNVSGLYGYDDGKPILTVSNVSSPVFVTVKSLPINPSGFCNGVGSDIQFRQDKLVQCNYDVSVFPNCTAKSNGIKAFLAPLLINSNVAIFGNPNSPADYVTVNTNSVPISSSVLIPGTPLANMVQFCTNIPTGLVITISYSRQGKARNEYINNIVGVTKRYQVNDVVNFTSFGASNNQYSLVTLTSYVEFVLVSGGINGTQNTDIVVQTVCNFDICFEELFYPWMFNYEGKRGFYEEAFGLFLLGLAIFLLSTTYPWW